MTTKVLFRQVISNPIHPVRVHFQLRTCISLLAISVVISACDPGANKAVEINPVSVITHSELLNIDSVTLDSSGRLYVSDMYTVKVFSDAGRLLHVIGGEGTGDGQFSDEAVGLVINSRGHLLVVDAGNCRVQVFDLQGNFIRSYAKQGTGKGEFLDPQGIVVDQHDLAYVTDRKRNDVQVFSPQGEYLYSIGAVSGKGSLNEPESMVIRNERLHVADEGNGRIQVYDLRGNYLKSLPRSGTLVTPKFEADLDDVLPPTEEDVLYSRYLDGDIEGIVFDDEGTLYLLDEDAGRVILLRGEEQVGEFFSKLPIASGDGMAVDGSFENLYIVDQGNSRVQAFELEEIQEKLVR